METDSKMCVTGWSTLTPSIDLSSWDFLDETLCPLDASEWICAGATMKMPYCCFSSFNINRIGQKKVLRGLR